MDDQSLIKTLLAQDEGPSLDFKSEPIRLGQDYQKAKLIKSIISMANTPRSGSSYIVYGVIRKPDGTKEAVGITEYVDDANIQALIGSKVRPVPKIHYRTVQYNKKTIGILEVFPLRGGPFLSDTEFGNSLRRGMIYLRHGSSNVEAEPSDVRDIVKWMGEPNQENSPDNKLERPASLPIAGISLALPCFFPSISSVKANLKPVEFLRIIISVDHPSLLISAYDLFNTREKRARKQMQSLLHEASIKKTAVVLDSGTYESYWHKDTFWKLKSFWSCLASYQYGFAFHFDKREQNLSIKNTKILVNEIERAVLRDQEKTVNGTIVPIIHAPKDILPETAKGVVERLAPLMIAIPERELGQGILERAETIVKIRRILATTGVYYPLHLLGTGNPLSILIYAISGADTFDGLEWCQTAVNHESALLYHFQQRELFDPLSDTSPLSSLPYTQLTLARNLFFYRKWMKEIQSACQSSKLKEFAAKYISKSFLDNLNNKIGESSR